jgi:hypothetical protein
MGPLAICLQKIRIPGTIAFMIEICRASNKSKGHPGLTEFDRLDFRRGATEIFKSLNLRNPLKSHDSDETIQEKPSK